MTVNWAALCTWCAHKHHHPKPCSGHIQTGTDRDPRPQPCPRSHRTNTTKETP